MDKCSVENCNTSNPKRIIKGFCPKHYQRYKKYGDANKGRTNLEIGTHLRWIEEHVNFDEDECLIWPFSKQINGYGSCSMANGKVDMAHRVMCREINGDNPVDKPIVRHFCGNGHLGCVNPKHLKWGTQIENRNDSKIHGTEKHGEDHKNSKLTEIQVLEIISRLDKGESSRYISKSYSVKDLQIGKIKRGEAWNWLTKRK